jgi:prepilin-type processing-associated H-X9-DG protein/prepilin-type N-terminal cleavage/methylation domain-containing protein
MNSPGFSPNCRAGFTLVELLVTIGIVVLLASLLVPVAGRWSSGADSVGCMNNLRQTHIYLNAYAQENNGVYPAVSDPVTGNSWWLTLQNFINSPDQVVGIGKKTVFLCPASLKTYPGRKARRTYGMNCEGLLNNEGVADWRVPTRPLTRTHPSKILFIADTKNGPANNGDGYQYFRADIAPKFTDVVEARHAGKANAMFLDGHIEAIDPRSPEADLAVRNLGK